MDVTSITEGLDHIQYQVEFIATHAHPEGAEEALHDTFVVVAMLMEHLGILEGRIKGEGERQ